MELLGVVIIETNVDEWWIGTNCNLIEINGYPVIIYNGTDNPDQTISMATSSNVNGASGSWTIKSITLTTLGYTRNLYPILLTNNEILLSYLNISDPIEGLFNGLYNRYTLKINNSDLIDTKINYIAIN